MRHLRLLHADQLSAPGYGASPMPATPPLEYSRDSPRFAECLRALVEFVAGDGLPLSVVESPRFRRLINTLDPRFSVPDRKFVKNHMQQVFGELTATARHTIESESVSVAVDTWTSAAMENYIGVTGQFINSEWALTKVHLGLRAISDGTAASIAEAASGALCGLRPFAIVTDNGQNVCASIQRMPSSVPTHCNSQ